MEFNHSSKATSTYLSSIEGKYSASKISDKDRKACLNNDASNSISESNHASSTHSLEASGTIRLNSSAGEGQMHTNNDFGHDRDAMVTGRSSKMGKLECPFESFHSFPTEGQQSIIETARHGSASTRKDFDDALHKQKIHTNEKEEIACCKKIDASREEYIVSIELWEQYHSSCC